MPFTLKLVSESLCLACRLCERVSSSISKLVLVHLRGHHQFLYLCCSLHLDTSEWVQTRSCEHMRSGAQAHLDQPLPERAASSSFGLGSVEENLAFALPWSHPSEFPMTVSSKGPNSSSTLCNSTSKFKSSCAYYGFFPSSDPNLSLTAFSTFSSSRVF